MIPSQVTRALVAFIITLSFIVSSFPSSDVQQVAGEQVLAQSPSQTLAAGSFHARMTTFGAEHPSWSQTLRPAPAEEQGAILNQPGAKKLGYPRRASTLSLAINTPSRELLAETPYYISHESAMDVHNMLTRPVMTVIITTPRRLAGREILGLP